MPLCLSECCLDRCLGHKDTFGVIQDCDYEGPKNIIIGFDGSSQEPDGAIQEQQKQPKMPYYKNLAGLSNVCKFHLMAGGNIGNSEKYFEDQVPFYYSGVGTRGSELGQTIRNLPFCSSGFAMDYIARLACRDLAKVYKEGDKVYVFGFSRGAATARLFASYLSKTPINDIDVKIELLGVYDTVPQTWKYSTTNDIEKMDYWKEGKIEKPENVKKVVHFLAIDEYRVIMNPTQFAKEDDVTEIWHCGCHSDCGGGYFHDGISDAVLNSMMIVAKEAGVQFREITEEMCMKKDRNIVDERFKNMQPDLFKKFDKDMQVSPNASDKDIHDEYKPGMMYKINEWKNFKHRELCVKDKKGVKMPDEPILLLDITEDRIKNFAPKTPLEELEGNDNYPRLSYVNQKYRPEHLKGVKYRLVNSKDMSISDEVYTIEERVEW